MDGHPMMAAKKEVTTASPIWEPKEPSLRNPLFDDEPVSSGKTSSKTHDNYAMEMEMEKEPQYQRVQLAKEQDNLYPEPQNHLHLETQISEKYVSPVGLSSGYLSGPMMIMVRPDGTPVRAYMPKDDDRMVLGKDKIPTLEQLSQSYRTTRNFLDENHGSGQPGAFYYHKSIRSNRQWLISV